MVSGAGPLDGKATPEATARSFADAVARRDQKAAGTLLVAESCLLTPDGTEVRGKANVEEVLAQLTITHPRIRVEVGQVLTAGLVAVASQRWWISSKSADEGLFERSLPALLVLGQHQGGWRVSVVAPWGI